ncbi:MAG TPA: hypothetical protein DCL21_00360 [Alphaproteobacteria bacterium]|nr:hypothetical protein [Alphaproteobacteria bacterium]
MQSIELKQSFGFVNGIEKKSLKNKVKFLQNKLVLQVSENKKHSEVVQDALDEGIIRFSQFLMKDYGVLMFETLQGDRLFKLYNLDDFLNSKLEFLGVRIKLENAIFEDKSRQLSLQYTAELINRRVLCVQSCKVDYRLMYSFRDKMMLNHLKHYNFNEFGLELAKNLLMVFDYDDILRVLKNAANQKNSKYSLDQLLTIFLMMVQHGFEY